MTTAELMILMPVAEKQGISIDELIKKSDIQSTKDSILSGLYCLEEDLRKLTYHIARYFVLEEITKETH